MAVAKVAASAPQQFEDVTSVTFGFAAGSGASKAVVDVGWYRGTSVTVTSVTYDGVAMTSAGSSNVNFDFPMRIHSFYIDSPPTGSVNVVVNFSSSNTNRGTCGATSYSGTATGIGAVTSSNSQSDTPSVTEPDSTAGNMVHGALAASYQATTLTPNDTENWTGASGTAWKAASQCISGGGSKTIDWTASSAFTAWAAQCFELTAAASANVNAQQQNAISSGGF